MYVYVHFVLSDILEIFCLLRFVLLLLWKHVPTCRCLRQVFSCLWYLLVDFTLSPTMYLFFLEREIRYLFLHVWFCRNEISFVVFALFVCRLLQKATSWENMKHHQLKVLFARLDFQKLMKCHQVTFLHISWGIQLKLMYGQGVIRYKMQYMYSIVYLLYFGVISNYIIASIAYLLYYWMGNYCCFLMQNLFYFLSVCIFSFWYI
jgi:hypothetical protein